MGFANASQGIQGYVYMVIKAIMFFLSRKPLNTHAIII